jgi:hypothetical protein
LAYVPFFYNGASIATLPERHQGYLRPVWFEIPIAMDTGGQIRLIRRIAFPQSLFFGIETLGGVGYRRAAKSLVGIKTGIEEGAPIQEPFQSLN